MSNQIVDVIDVSHWQEKVDFAKVKAAGVVGVILKATEGTGNTDQTYASRRAAALAAGLEVSSYHFLRPGNIVGQMERFLAVVDPRLGERVCLDHEDKGVSLNDLKNAVRHLQGDERDLQVTIYSGNVIKEQLGERGDDLLATTSLWLAHYTDAPEPKWPKGTWPTWTLWQYTDRGEVDGVAGNCDVNRFNGSKENCRIWMTPAVQVPSPAPEPAPDPVAPLENTVRVNISVPPGVTVQVNVNGEVLVNNVVE